MSERSERTAKGWIKRRLRLDRTFWTQALVKDVGCWIWTGSHQGGVGRERYGLVVREHRRYLAHRYAYMLVNGPIPDGLNVLHRCDVPLCVNPDHLFLGTQADNLRDMISKGRHPQHRLPVARLQVAEAGEPVPTLAEAVPWEPAGGYHDWQGGR